MEELDRPRQAGVSITVLACLVPDRHRPRQRPDKEPARWPCWQTPSRSPVGVDTHNHTHTAAVVAAATGATTATLTIAATAVGYQRLLELADQHDRRRVWAIEGTGGDGAGLTGS